MSADSTRRAAAVLLVILGGAALWWAGSAAQASASANDAVVVTIAAAREHAAASDPRLKSSSRFEQGGWIYVHLEGDPGTVGYQHGYLLAPEIEDGFAEEFPVALRGMHHPRAHRSEEHTSELQSPCNLVCRLLLEKKKHMALDHWTV